MAMFNNQMVYSVSFTGWWLTHPSEKYESVGIVIPDRWKNKIHVPNHQPVRKVSRKLGNLPGD